jgi:hypothetical protein
LRYAILKLRANADREEERYLGWLVEGYEGRVRIAFMKPNWSVGDDEYNDSMVVWEVTTTSAGALDHLIGLLREAREAVWGDPADATTIEGGQWKPERGQWPTQ